MFSGSEKVEDAATIGPLWQDLMDCVEAKGGAALWRRPVPL